MADFFQTIFERIVIIVVAITVAISSPFNPSNSDQHQPLPSPANQAMQTASPIPSSTPSSPSPKPNEVLQNKPKENNQFEVTTSNIKYIDTLEGVKVRDCAENDLECQLENSRAKTIPLGGRYRFNADLKIKNISISPFVTGYQLSNCEVVKNGSQTAFSMGSSGEFNKGVLPGESTAIKIDAGFGGFEYDSSGNKIQPSSDLRVESCNIVLQAKDGSSKSKTIRF